MITSLENFTLKILHLNFFLHIYNKIIKMKDIIRMNQLAGIITEGQAKKMMAILNEAEDFKVGETYTASMPTDSTGNKRMDVKVKFLGKGRSNDGTLIVTPIQDVKYKNSESGQEDRFEKDKQYNTEAKYLKS